MSIGSIDLFQRTHAGIACPGPSKLLTEPRHIEPHPNPPQGLGRSASLPGPSRAFVQPESMQRRAPLTACRRRLAGAGALSLLLLGLLGGAATAQQPHLRVGRGLHELSAPGVLPDSRRGDPNVATGTTSDPPKRVWEDRAHVDAVTNNPWIAPWLFLYDAGLFANSLVEGFPDCQWHARVRLFYFH